jgi:hypothetical protein
MSPSISFRDAANAYSDPPLGPAHPDRADDGGAARRGESRQGPLPQPYSMWAWQFAKANHVSTTPFVSRFVSMQNHYNLPNREEARELLSARGRRRRLHLTWG